MYRRGTRGPAELRRVQKYSVVHAVSLCVLGSRCPWLSVWRRKFWILQRYEFLGGEWVGERVS